MSFNAVVLKQTYPSIKCGIKEKVILANTILYIILEQQKHSDSFKTVFNFDFNYVTDSVLHHVIWGD